MTSQTKQFIELSDILAFRFECPNCHCSTIIPVKGFNVVPTRCPNGCGREWEHQHTHGVTESFKEWVGAMELIRDRTKQLGLSFSLEIAESVKGPAA
jgi:hypothetical protein